MAEIKIPVVVLDERCASCQCISLRKEDLYADFDKIITQFSCEHLHMCQYIKNRIVRGEAKEEKHNE